VETAIRNDLRDVLDLAEAGKRIPKELIVSLSDPLGDDSSGEPMCYEDVVADPNALNAEALVISADEVKSILSVLPDRQRKIVIRHLGLDGYDPRTMAAVATSMRLSKITIRREYAAAMTTLREQFGVEDVATTLEVLHAA
jgi:DNA-directed RNA polymerase sigma subunit (sigma70/sigma32)